MQELKSNKFKSSKKNLDFNDSGEEFSDFNPKRLNEWFEKSEKVSFQVKNNYELTFLL